MNSPKCMYEVEGSWDASGAEDGGWKDAVYEAEKGKRNNSRYEWKEIPTSLIIPVGPLKLTETRWCSPWSSALFPRVDQRVASARRTSSRRSWIFLCDFYLECFNTSRPVDDERLFYEIYIGRIKNNKSLGVWRE